MSSVFDPGKSDRDKASKAAKSGLLTGGDFSGPGGLGGGFSFKNGKANINSDLGSFQGILDSMMSASQAGFAQSANGLPPEMMAAFQAAQSGLAGTRGSSEADRAALGQVMDSSMGTATADPWELGSQVSDKLRGLAERKNKREAMKMFDKLRSNGQMSSSMGAAKAFELDNQQFEQGMQFDLAGLNAGRSLQGDAMQRLMQAQQGRAGINQQLDANSLSGANVQSAMLDAFLRNQSQGVNIGLANATGGQNLAQMPLSFMSAMLSAGQAGSGSYFQKAGVDQQNAAMAKSPLMEAVNMGAGIAASFI